MSSTLAKIVDWASGLKYWEQAALKKILASAPLTQDDYTELRLYFLQDAGLEACPANRPPLFSSDAKINGEPDVVSPIKVRRIFNLCSVNALPSGQELTFGDQLTVVFGANGSGKTGYARVLACAAFARGERSVLPDVTKPFPTTPPQADIEIEDADGLHAVKFTDGNRCPQLAPLHVFDTKSVEAHLTRENTLAFFPAGLDYLAELARVTDQVRDQIRREIQSRRATLGVTALYEGESSVASALAALNRNPDLANLRTLASLTDTEKSQIAAFETEIASIKATDIPGHTKTLRQESADLRTLCANLETLAQQVNDRALDELGKFVRAWEATRAEAQRASAVQFNCQHLHQVGTDAWNKFIEAAWILAVAESSKEDTYPHDGDVCLLCRQPLNKEASELIRRLWKYLSSDAQTRFASAEATRNVKSRDLTSLAANFFSDSSSVRRLLATLNPELVTQIDALISCCLTRRDAAVGMLNSASPAEVRPLTSTYKPDLETLACTKDEEANSLEKQSQTDRLLSLETSLRELKHRQLLTSHLHLVEEHVSNRSWADTAELHLGSTHGITLEQNKLFKELVSDRYLDLFHETVASFGRQLSVSIETRGQKGQHVRQIVLTKCSTASQAGAPIHEILSEGEKRAVALADFLTEVSVNASSSGVVFDDPVTSLDAEWKDAFAKRLAEEARSRQVIIFTHDLPFLYKLTKYAEEMGIGVTKHWIQRPAGQEPGHVFLDNSPACEQEYKSTDRARKFYADSKNAPPDRQEYLLQQGFGALRTTYEIFTIMTLFGGVVRRFDERIRIMDLRQIAWSDEIADRAVEKFEYLSRFIEGHSHSDAFAPTKPTPELLLQEIESFEKLKREHQDLKKKKVASKTAAVAQSLN